MIHRCEAGPQIGTGHFFRQLALAEEAKARGRDPLLLVTGLTEGLIRQAEAAGVAVEASPAKAGSKSDARLVARYGEARECAGVVVDGYRFGPGYYRRLGKTFDVVTAVDDVGEQVFPVDVLVNVNPHAPKLDYPRPTRCLLGPRYALLRQQFAEAREHIDRNSGPPVPEAVRRVLVAFGGGDPGRLTRLAMVALERAGYSGRVDLVVGPAAGSWAERREQQDPLDLHVHRNVSDMVRLMKGQHLAMSAAGGMTWELACLGVPIIQTAVADNQRPIARALEEQGVTVKAGTRSSVEPDQLADLFRRLSRDRSLRVRMSSRGMELVDGQGAGRVLEAIEQAESGEAES